MTRDRKPECRCHGFAPGHSFKGSHDLKGNRLESQPRVVAECWTCPAPELFAQVIATDRCRATGHDVREVKA